MGAVGGKSRLVKREIVCGDSLHFILANPKHNATSPATEISQEMKTVSQKAVNSKQNLTEQRYNRWHTAPGIQGLHMLMMLR